MRIRTAKLALVVFLTLSLPAFAQDGVIDLFEGQSDMKATTVTLESSSGPVIESGNARGGGYTPGAGGGFTLNFERTGNTILVPATVNGRDAYFLFDTGASYTTLTGDFARTAGITPRKDYPSLTLQTANGLIRSKLGIIDALVLGGRAHDGVTFGVCDRCPTGTYKGKPIVGLLGMNVIGRYRTSFDHSKGVIEMAPSDGYLDRWRDIEPWVDVKFTAHRVGGKERTLLGWVENRSPRSIRQMTLEYWCKGGARGRADRSLGANKREKFSVTIGNGDCTTGYHGEVVSARW